MSRKYTRYSRRLDRNILACYLRANEGDREEGMYWYAQAHSSAVSMAEKHKVSVKQAVGVIAAMSPGLNWGLNLLQANELIEAWQKGLRGEDLPRLGTYGRRNIIKATSILLGADPLDVLPPTGPKVRSFYQNILDPRSPEVVTIDRHAKCLALNSSSTRHGASNEKDAIVTRAEYPYYARHYVAVAERLGLIPNQLQAICWVTWRRLQGNLDQLDLVPF